MNPQLEALRRYLKQLADLTASRVPDTLYPGIPGLLLERGEAFCGPGEPLTEEEAFAVANAAAAWPQGYKQKECFYNSQRLAIVADEIAYYEGYAWNMIPCHHAWVVINGKVVDLTWRKEELELGDRLGDGSFLDRYAIGVMPEEGVYLGVRIDVSDAIERMAATQVCCSYLDDWQNGHPLLQRAAWGAPDA